MSKTSLIGFYAYAYPEDKMRERIDNAVKELKKKGVEVNFIGYVSDRDEASIERAKEKLDKTAYDSTSITLVISAWCESPPIIRVISNHFYLPMLMWAIAGYRTKAGLITPAAATGVAALNFALKTFGIKHISVYDAVDKGMRTDEVVEFINFASAIKDLRNTKIASIGHVDMNLYSFMYDGNLIKKYTGIHVDSIDLIDLKILMDKVTKSEVSDFIKDLGSKVLYIDEPSKQDLDTLARSYIAINKIIDEKDYKGITLKCILGMSKLMNFSPCMLESLIGDKVDTICECNVPGLVAQVIVKKLTGQKAIFQAFREFYESSMLVGTCGFAPFSLCDEDRPKVQNHNWGGAGGLMNVSKLKTGKVTLLNLYTINGQMHMHLVTGEAKTPEKWQEDGYGGKGPKTPTPSLEIEIDGNLEEFQENVVGQHFIVAYGDISKLMKRYCKFTGIRFNEHNKIDFNYR